MANNPKRFEYDLLDAWSTPLSSITLLDAEGGMIACYGTYKDEKFHRFEPVESRSIIHSVAVSTAAGEKIIEILQDAHLYELDPLEHPWVLDGYLHRLYFSNGEKQIELIGDNMACCEDDEAKYPNVNYAIKVLRAIGEILISEGVDKQCFSLERAE